MVLAARSSVATPLFFDHALICTVRCRKLRVLASGLGRRSEFFDPKARVMPRPF
jgi:hypothetical protein